MVDISLLAAADEMPQAPRDSFNYTTATRVVWNLIFYWKKFFVLWYYWQQVWLGQQMWCEMLAHVLASLHHHPCISILTQHPWCSQVAGEETATCDQHQHHCPLSLTTWLESPLWFAGLNQSPRPLLVMYWPLDGHNSHCAYIRSLWLLIIMPNMGVS